MHGPTQAQEVRTLLNVLNTLRDDPGHGGSLAAADILQGKAKQGRAVLEADVHQQLPLWPQGDAHFGEAAVEKRVQVERGAGDVAVLPHAADRAEGDLQVIAAGNLRDKGLVPPQHDVPVRPLDNLGLVRLTGARGPLAA